MFVEFRDGFCLEIARQANFDGNSSIDDKLLQFSVLLNSNSVSNSLRSTITKGILSKEREKKKIKTFEIKEKTIYSNGSPIGCFATVQSAVQALRSNDVKRILFFVSLLLIVFRFFRYFRFFSFYIYFKREVLSLPCGARN